MQEVISKLKQLEIKNPYVVTSSGDIITVALNLADSKWFTIFQANSLDKSFKINIKINEKAKTAVREIVEYEIVWEAGVPKLGAEIKGFKGSSISLQSGTELGLKQDGTVGKAVSYSLNSAEVQNQVKKVLIDCGYTIKLNKYAKIGLIFAVVGAVVAAITVVLAFILN